MKRTSVIILLSVGCASEEGVKVYNSNPEASIISMVDGDSFLEGDEVHLLGQVSDGNHDMSSLLVSWESANRVLCEQQAPSIDGSTSCTTNLELDDTSIRLRVIDPEGAAGMDQVDITITANQAPSISILSPAQDSQHYSDQLVLFSAQLEDAEDDVSSLSYQWTSSIDGVLPSTVSPDSMGIIEQYFALSEGQHAITLEVVDSGGKQSSETITVLVGSANRTPSCSISAPESQSAFVVGQAITFSGTALDDDINNSLLNISWSSDIDGVFNTSIADSSGDMEFFYDGLSAGNHSIRLRVEDEVGAFCTESILLSIGSAPEISLTSPNQADVFSVQESILFSGTVSDAEDIPSSIELSFTSDIDGVFSTTGADSNGNISFYVSTLQAGEHNIVIQATDTMGLYTTQSRQIRINTPPPAPSITISPSTPLSNEDISVSVVENPDPDGDTLSFSYAWFQNGVATSYSTDTIPASATDAGDVWKVHVTPNDGYIDGDYAQAEITIQSSAPEFDVEANITPSSGVYTGTLLSCSASAIDLEDGVLNPSYHWEINGVVVGSTSTYTIDATQSDVGDDVYCKATVIDTDQETANSETFVSIENTAPTQPSISISPVAPQPNQDDLVCNLDVVSTDIDLQSISYTYSWEKNGVATSHSTNTVPSTDVITGDSWVCFATPNDGVEDGATVQSAPISVSTSCPSSNATINSPSDVLAYELCTELDMIYISATSGINTVSFPNLVTVHDYIYVSNNSDLQTLSFPLLESVGGYVYFYHNYDIEQVSFPVLDHVDEYLYFDTNTSLYALDVDVLTFVGDYSYFSNNTELCVPELTWTSIAQNYHYDSGNRDCSTQTFVHTGSVQTFTVPNVTSIDVVLYGGAGGDGWNNDVSSNLGFGGEGAVVSATISVTPGETLLLYVGGMGEDATFNSWGLGGFNGGGDGAQKWNYYGGGGGGATDIRRGSALTDRLVVAGGGGAGSGWCTAGTGHGGDAGGMQGQNGQQCSSIPVGIGGSQSAGGNIGGALGIGGSASTNAGSGGGGGYYGGGASDGSGAGGGSSYIGSSASGTMIAGGSVGEGLLTISW